MVVLLCIICTALHLHVDIMETLAGARILVSSEEVEILFNLQNVCVDVVTPFAEALSLTCADVAQHLGFLVSWACI